MPTYYTESKRVELHVIGGALVTLLPGTQVTTTQVLGGHDTSEEESHYIKVTVPSLGVQGWLPRRVLRKRDKIGHSSVATQESFTGVTYGLYKFDDSGKRLTWQESERGECNTCGHSHADHRIYETVELHRMTQTIRTSLSQRMTLPKKMMGVLEAYMANGQRLLAVAVSGPTKIQMLQKIVEEPGGLQDQLGLPILVVDEAPTYPLVNFLNRHLREQDLNYAKCAAPILLQWFIKRFILEQGSGYHARSIIYLSETLLDEPAPGQSLYEPGHTAESCAKCRRIMPRMLCGHVNVDKTERY